MLNKKIDIKSTNMCALNSLDKFVLCLKTAETTQTSFLNKLHKTKNNSHEKFKLFNGHFEFKNFFKKKYRLMLFPLALVFESIFCIFLLFNFNVIYSLILKINTRYD